VHHDARISDQSDAALSRALHFLKDDQDLPVSIRDLVKRALVRLPPLPPSRIRVDALAAVEDAGTFDYLAPPEVEATVGTPRTLRAPARGTGRRQKAPSRPHRFLVTGRAFCPTCRGVVDICRPLPNRPAHRWATVLTLGLWLIPWGVVEAGARFQRWRCTHCGRRVSPARQA